MFIICHRLFIILHINRGFKLICIRNIPRLKFKINWNQSSLYREFFFYNFLSLFVYIIYRIIIYLSDIRILVRLSTLRQRKIGINKIEDELFSWSKCKSVGMAILMFFILCFYGKCLYIVLQIPSFPIGFFSLFCVVMDNIIV